jgi:hypothetical protein
MVIFQNKLQGDIFIMENALLSELTSLANDLDASGFVAEADQIDKIIKNAEFVKEAGLPAIYFLYAAGAALLGSTGTAAYLNLSPSEEAVLLSSTNTTSFGQLLSTRVSRLKANYLDSLARTDLIFGMGSFPKDGGNSAYEFIQQMEYLFDNETFLTEAEFERYFEQYYGQSAGGILQWGLDNETGWQKTFNFLLRLEALQDAVDHTNGCEPVITITANEDWVSELSRKIGMPERADVQFDEGDGASFNDYYQAYMEENDCRVEEPTPLDDLDRCGFGEFADRPVLIWEGQNDDGTWERQCAPDPEAGRVTPLERGDMRDPFDDDWLPGDEDDDSPEEAQPEEENKPII